MTKIPAFLESLHRCQGEAEVVSAMHADGFYLENATWADHGRGLHYTDGTSPIYNYIYVDTRRAMPRGLWHNVSGVWVQCKVQVKTDKILRKT